MGISGKFVSNTHFMKKIYLLLLVFVLISCQQKVSQGEISKINGYWEIDKVVFSDGTEKQYGINETFDYFQIKGNNGFRKKVMPQLDGRFLVNNQSEHVKVTFEKETVFLNYTTPYAKWKEELQVLSDDKMVIVNRTQNKYFYKKTGPINIANYGKKNR